MLLSEYKGVLIFFDRLWCRTCNANGIDQGKYLKTKLGQDEWLELTSWYLLLHKYKIE